MCGVKNRWLQDFANGFRLVFHKQYIDDTFALAGKFEEYLSFKIPTNVSSEKKMAVYVFYILTFFVKMENLKLTFRKKKII